jgi:ABC-type cobalamin/Fe3+-siderophores transport system ATPase subunit
METLVKVSCLKHIYPDTTEIHICGLDFVVNRGERVVILGGNGSGKTTLLFHILGLLAPNEGSVSVFNINPALKYNTVASASACCSRMSTTRSCLRRYGTTSLYAPQLWLDKERIAQMVERSWPNWGSAGWATRSAIICQAAKSESSACRRTGHAAGAANLG